ncbi:MAG: ArsR family transcriptional regulator [Sandaracinaceae bacterium]|nr:ArsR family transcriptional regulator [Sandaracinaceae bacterium]
MLSPAEQRVTETIGRLMEFWGFKRHMGRLWALLYLSERPLAAKEIRDRLDLSVGTVSMTLAELQRWGVVKGVHQPGVRAELFEAELSLWKMVSRVFRERELFEVTEAVASLEAALADLGREASSERTSLQRSRIEALLEVARLGKGLLEVLVSTGRVDASELARLLLGNASSAPSSRG